VIDTHCHLLPALDDGPPSEKTGLELARALVAEGIDRVVCTPHYSSLFPTDEELARERFASFSAAVERERIPLRLDLAAEVGPAQAVSAPVAELRRRAIMGRFVLVEVQPDVSLPFFESVVERLQGAQLEIVFGHPERARSLGRSLGLVDDLRREGCLMQVVAPSLLSRWGGAVAELAWRLVDTGRADLLGSDAHGIARRRVHLREAGALIESRLGPGVVEELTERKPALLLDGGGSGESWT
jgi:protein-tyrosine phosphatase